MRTANESGGVKYQNWHDKVELLVDVVSWREILGSCCGGYCKVTANTVVLWDSQCGNQPRGGNTMHIKLQMPITLGETRQ